MHWAGEMQYTVLEYESSFLLCLVAPGGLRINILAKGPQKKEEKLAKGLSNGRTEWFAWPFYKGCGWALKSFYMALAGISKRKIG